jgi:hypothetical protein
MYDRRTSYPQLSTLLSTQHRKYGVCVCVCGLLPSRTPAQSPVCLRCFASVGLAAPPQLRSLNRRRACRSRHTEQHRCCAGLRAVGGASLRERSPIDRDQRAQNKTPPHHTAQRTGYKPQSSWRVRVSSAIQKRKSSEETNVSGVKATTNAWSPSVSVVWTPPAETWMSPSLPSSRRGFVYALSLLDALLTLPRSCCLLAVPSTTTIAGFS